MKSSNNFSRLLTYNAFSQSCRGGKMKKNYIHLRHQQYADVVPSQLTHRSQLCALPLIPHSAIASILDCLRLCQISQLYTSLALNHKHQELKRTIFNYMALCNRVFSKWEQKQFLDFLTLGSETPSPKKQTHFRQASDKLNYSTIWRHPCLPCRNVQYSQNDKSRLIRCKESIFNDVDRTYLKNNGRGELKRLENREYSVKNLLKSSYQVGTKHKTEILSKQTSLCSGTLVTEPHSSIGCDQKSKDNTRLNSDFDKKTQQNYDLIWEMQCSHQQKMQNFLKSVLVTICEKYEKVGYIQGFNYIVKNMFLTGFSEEEACRYLSYFIEQKNLGSIVFNSMIGIKKLSYALKVYIFNYVPLIYQHFAKVEVEPEVFCMSWFVTLFSEDLSVEIVNKLWHLFVLEGWKAFIKFAISFLCAYQTEILTKQADEIFSFMRRIMENFNQQCKVKTRLSHYRWGSNQKRQEVVWKLMTSVEVNGNILNRLCQEMSNLQSDCEIELWRIEGTSRNYEGRARQNFDKHSLSTIKQSRRQDRSTGRYAHQTNMRGAEMCCDRMYLQTNQNFYGRCRPSNIFSLCHNVDTCID